MSAENQQFNQTYAMFRDYLSGYPKKLTYEEWNKAEAEDKAALLYVRFFKEVTLAWCNSTVTHGIVYVTQEDGISTVLQYLMKNVDKISEDPKRFTPQYIYTVCYNCLRSLVRTRNTDKHRSTHDIPHKYTEGDVSVDLFDLVPSDDDDLETAEIKEAVWEIIHHMGPKAEKVVNHIINPKDTLKRVSKKTSAGKLDRLADISVSEEEYEEIVAELKVRLAPYRDIIFLI